MIPGDMTIEVDDLKLTMDKSITWRWLDHHWGQGIRHTFVEMLEWGNSEGLEPWKVLAMITWLVAYGELVIDDHGLISKKVA